MFFLQSRLIKLQSAAEQKRIGLQQLHRIPLSVTPTVIQCFTRRVPKLLFEKSQILFRGGAIAFVAQHSRGASQSAEH